MKLVTESLCYRWILALVAIYHKGSLYGFFQAVKKSYGYSKTKMLWGRFASQPVAQTTSGYYGFLQRCNQGLAFLGGICKNSLLYGFFAGCGRLLRPLFFGSIFQKVGLRPLILLVFCLYLPVDYILRSVLNISLLASLWDEGLLLLALGYILYRKAVKPTAIGTRATLLDGFLYLFIAVGFFLMCTVAPYPAVAFDGYRAVVQYLFWFFIIINLLEDDADFALFYGLLVAMAVVVGLHGIYQYIIKVPIPSTWISQAEGSVRTRVFSIMGSPNVMGSFLVLFAPLVAALAYFCKNIWLKLFALSMTGMLCLSLIFTSSKGAWGGIAVAIVIFAIYLDRRLIVLMVAGAGAGLALIPSIANRISFMFTADYVAASMKGGRMVRWETGMQLLNESDPWLGFGLGRFGGAVAMQNKLMEETETFKYFYMDNYYLKTMVEMGYIGLFFYLLLLGGLMYTCLRAIERTRQSRVFPLAVGMFSGMMGVLVHCYFENIFEVPYMTAYFWSLAAGVLYLGYFRPKKEAGIKSAS